MELTTPDRDKTHTVTDEEIRRIIDANEPGVADVLAAFDQADEFYAAAAAGGYPAVTYGSFTY